ncbi:MAG: glycerophosphodiester phosphodiesterase family protein [Cyclobacteriaceae bacterium]
MKYLIYLSLLVFNAGCNHPVTQESTRVVIDLQGHRGARGLMPENSIPAFLRALDYNNVTTLELDLAVTSDNHLVVSHEPWFNPVICKSPDGEELNEQDKISIYSLTYEQIKEYDCGSGGNPRFPDQKKMKTYKPLLSEVMSEVKKKLKNTGRQSINYNIEIKSSPQLDSIFTPSPEKFADLVYSFVTENMNIQQVTIQSFDFRVLRYLHEKYPEVRLVALVENEKSEEENLRILGFKPEIYSPYYKTLTQNSIKYLQGKNIDVIPWTVNDTTAMKQLIKWQVDGIITDYPNLAQKILE